MELMGAEMTGNVRTWGGAQRRVGSILAITASIVILLAGVIAYVIAGDIPWLYWTLAGILALILVFVIVLLFVNAEADDEQNEALTASRAAAPAGEYPEEAPELDSRPPPSGPKLTLRCGDCGTVFDIPDDGTRPLYHSCPGCGAEGVLRENTPAPPTPTPAPAAPIDTGNLPAAPAAAPSPLNAPRRLKLRCGGCKEVFVIEDTGERPLRRPCPHCSRMGEIR